MTFVMMLSVILLSMLTLFSTLSQLELASELKCDLRDTADWDRNWLVDFNATKTKLISSDQSKN